MVVLCYRALVEVISGPTRVLTALTCAVLVGAQALATESRRWPALAQAPPVLRVRPARLSFIASQDRQSLPPQRVEISSAGTRTTWRARASEAWIIISPREGVTPGVLVVSIDAKDLEPGQHAGRVIVDGGSAGSQPVEIIVAIASSKPVEPAVLKVTADRITFEVPVDRPDRQSFPIRLEADSEQAIRWTARVDRPWLTLSASQGTTPAEVLVFASPQTMPVGDHAGQLTIRGGAGGQQIEVPVLLSIRSGAAPLGLTTITLPPATLNLSYSQPVPVRGGRPPYFIQLAGGQLPPDLALVDGTLRGIARRPGTFSISVAITDSSAPAATIVQSLTLPVIILNPATALVVEPQTINLVATTGAPAPETTLKIASGGPPLAWRVSTDTPWLRASPSSGIAPATATILADATGLTSGTFVGTLIVAMDGAPNSPRQVSVQLVVKR